MAIGGERTIWLFFEGDAKLKPGFRQFFREIYELTKNRRYFRLVDTGGTPAEDYATGVRTNPEDWNILLLDSDGPVTPDLLGRKGLRQADRDSVFWMVQVMESWFLSDKDALKRYYGVDFTTASVPANLIVKEIPKGRVLDALDDATRNTKKGKYHKTKHAPDLLAAIEPALVRKASPQCERLFNALHGELDAP